VRRYVEHRLAVAGHRRGRIFTSAALALLTRAGEGIPRNINTTCFEALSLAYAAGKKKVDEPIMARAAIQRAQGETPLWTGQPRLASWRWQWAGGGAAVGLLAAALLGGGYWRRFASPVAARLPEMWAERAAPAPALAGTEVMDRAYARIPRRSRDEPGAANPNRDTGDPKPSSIRPVARRLQVPVRARHPQPSFPQPAAALSQNPPLSELLQAPLRSNQWASPATADRPATLPLDPSPPIHELLRLRPTPVGFAGRNPASSKENP